MSRTTLIMLLAAFTTIALSGCRMCQHPYDYSGPVYYRHGNSCASCLSHGRAGSVLEGGAEFISEEPAPEEIIHSRATNKAAKNDLALDGPLLGDVPGSERIISVTERVVAPGETTGTASQMAESNAQPMQKSMPSKGWTARNPSSSSDWH
jgi:hypothetical protein